jgi:DNA repair exonuclease SbcCD ATPase subunit
MHINASKNLCVEIYWDNYKIERRRKPDSLKFWKDDTGKFDDSTELTLGGMPATQTLIENTLGLNYQTFINIFIFTDDNSTSFLECDAAEKRNIVENLLSLEKYRSYNENAKVLHKQHQASIKSLQTEIDYIESNLKTLQRNAESFQQKKTAWKQAKIEEIRSLGNSISSAEKEKIELEKNDDL